MDETTIENKKVLDLIDEVEMERLKRRRATMSAEDKIKSVFTKKE